MNRTQFLKRKPQVEREKPQVGQMKPFVGQCSTPKFDRKCPLFGKVPGWAKNFLSGSKPNRRISRLDGPGSLLGKAPGCTHEAPCWIDKAPDWEKKASYWALKQAQFYREEVLGWTEEDP